jgi:phosphonopyruvate decarboxylase
MTVMSPPRLEASTLLAALAARGVTDLSGVPCSSMTGLINAAQSGAIPYANAPNEGEALAYGAGAWLGGGLAAVLCQNSGLGNLYNCLTSLSLPYAIPAVLLCGWRGMPGRRDEPQHEAMGRMTPTLFQGVGIEPELLNAGTDLERTLASVSPDSRNLSAILVAPAALEDAEAQPAGGGRRGTGELVRRGGAPVVDRRGAIALLADAAGGGAGVIVSTGLLSREYFAMADSARLFCMAGSMGHAAAIGLGAHARSKRPMLIVEGDGSLIMRPQAMLFVGSEAPAAFAHVVVDNGVHESTGGQPSLSASADLAAAAIAFGYRLAVDTADPALAAEVAAAGLAGEGPVFVRLHIAPGGAVPPRIGLPFPEMAGRFRRFLAGPAAG